MPSLDFMFSSRKSRFNYGYWRELYPDNLLSSIISIWGKVGLLLAKFFQCSEGLRKFFTTFIVATLTLSLMLFSASFIFCFVVVALTSSSFIFLNWLECLWDWSFPLLPFARPPWHLQLFSWQCRPFVWLPQSLPWPCPCSFQHCSLQSILFYLDQDVLVMLNDPFIQWASYQRRFVSSRGRKIWMRPPSSFGLGGRRTWAISWSVVGLE